MYLAVHSTSVIISKGQEVDLIMERNVINLEEVVRDWAWREYDATATTSQKKLRRKDTKEPRKYLRLEVDWCETIFRDETRWTPLCVDESESAASVTTNNAHGLFDADSNLELFVLIQNNTEIQA